MKKKEKQNGHHNGTGLSGGRGVPNLPSAFKKRKRKKIIKNGENGHRNGGGGNGGLIGA